MTATKTLEASTLERQTNRFFVPKTAQSLISANNNVI
jgi:hypothetical protein